MKIIMTINNWSNDFYHEIFNPEKVANSSFRDISVYLMQVLNGKLFNH